MLGVIGVVQIVSQALLSLALAALFLAFFRAYRRQHLRLWAWSWLAHAVWGLSGLLLGTLASGRPPSADPLVLALNWVFLAAAYAQIAWLLLGTYEFATGTRSATAAGRAGAAAAIAATLILLASLDSTAVETRGFALRLGLRLVVGAVAAFVMAAYVHRASARPLGLGRLLMPGAFAFNGCVQLAYLATALVADPTRVLLLQPLGFVAHAALAGGMIVWLLEDERARVVRISEEKALLRRAQECAYAISELARQAGDLDELFASIHRILGRVVPARNFYIALVDAPLGQLHFPYWVDEKDPQPRPAPLGNGLTEYVLRSRQPLLATPERAAELQARGEIERRLTPSLDWLGVPLLLDGEAIGALAIQSYDGASRLGPDDRDLLVFVADQVAAVIESRRAQSEQRVSQESYRRLFEANPHPMIVYDRETLEILAANDAAVGQYGYSHAELLASTMPDLLVPEDAPRVLAEIPTHDAFVSYGGTRVHRRKDGARIDVTVHAHGLLWGGRRARVVSAVDVTEVRRANEARELLIRELAAKNAELERFSYTVSHDLKSPLVTIQGFVGAIEADLRAGDVERAKDALARIAGAGQRMQRLLEDLLELSRIGRIVNPPQDTALGELAREAVELVRGLLDEKNVAVEISDGLPTVRGDRQRLLEVFQNLIENAAKFSGSQPRPRVEIGARAENGGQVFYVRDNGQGIDPRFRDRVFDLFERLDPRAEGTGVGLALARRIVEAHGGRIWAESEGPGRGATFCFTLSSAPQPRTTPERPGVTPSGASSTE